MSIFENAVRFALERHSGQVRKTNKIPYIVHPFEVTSIISTMTDSENVLCAGMLHDTVEDTDTTAEEIIELFGERIAELVASETEPRFDGEDMRKTWQRRKEISLAELGASDDKEIKILWLSDKLSNLRSFYRGWLEEGNDFWNHFDQKDPKKQEWYYRTVAQHVSVLSDTAAYKEYTELLDRIFG